MLDSSWPFFFYLPCTTLDRIFHCPVWPSRWQAKSHRHPSLACLWSCWPFCSGPRIASQSLGDTLVKDIHFWHSPIRRDMIFSRGVAGKLVFVFFFFLNKYTRWFWNKVLGQEANNSFLTFWGLSCSKHLGVGWCPESRKCLKKSRGWPSMGSRGSRDTQNWAHPSPHCPLSSTFTSPASAVLQELQDSLYLKWELNFNFKLLLTVPFARAQK